MEFTKSLNDGKIPEDYILRNGKIYIPTKRGMTVIGSSEGNPIILYKKTGPVEAKKIFDGLKYEEDLFKRGKKILDDGTDGDDNELDTKLSLNLIKAEVKHINGEVGLIEIDKETGNGSVRKMEISGATAEAGAGAEFSAKDGLDVEWGIKVEAAGANVAGKIFKSTTEYEDGKSVLKIWGLEGELGAGLGYSVTGKLSKDGVKAGLQGIIGVKGGYFSDEYDDLSYLSQKDRDSLELDAINNELDSTLGKFTLSDEERAALEARKAELIGRNTENISEFIEKIRENIEKLRENITN